jgi:hypothetical protein
MYKFYFVDVMQFNKIFMIKKKLFEIKMKNYKFMEIFIMYIYTSIILIPISYLVNKSLFVVQ